MTGIKLRRMATSVNGAGFPPAYQGRTDGHLPFFKVSDFHLPGNERYLRKCTNWISRDDAIALGARVVPPESILLPKVGAALLGNARRLTTCPSLFDNNVLAIVPRVGHSHYLHYWTTTIDAGELSYPGPVPSLTGSELLDLTVPIQSLPQQRAIADFLDTETARIDTLIAKKRRMLRLLEERRRSYLQNLLTSSGSRLRNLEWLGNVPEEWPLVKLGVVGDFYAGTTFPHNYQGQAAGDYPFIKVGDLWSDEAGTAIDTATNWITRFNAQALGGRIVPAGSVLYARVGEALRLNPRRLTRRPSLVDDNVRAIHFRYGDGRYWSEILMLLDLAQLSNPGPIPSVSEGQVATVRVPLASTREQIRIADAMAREREVRSKVSASIIEQLGRLAEHRQALITEAVTGQLKVPGVAAS